MKCGPILCSRQTGLEGYEKDFPMACWATEEREKQKCCNSKMEKEAEKNDNKHTNKTQD